MNKVRRRTVSWHHNRPGDEAEELAASTATSNYPVRQLPFVNSGFIAEQRPSPSPEVHPWWFPLWDTLDARLDEMEVVILETGVVMLDLEEFREAVQNILRQRIPMHWQICDYVRRRFPLAQVGWYSIPPHQKRTRWHYADVLHPPSKYYKAPNALFVLMQTLDEEELAQYIEDLDVMAADLMQGNNVYAYIDAVIDSQPVHADDTIERIELIASHLPACNFVVRDKGQPLINTLNTVRDWLIKKDQP